MTSLISWSHIYFVQIFSIKHKDETKKCFICISKLQEGKEMLQDWMRYWHKCNLIIMQNHPKKSHSAKLWTLCCTLSETESYELCTVTWKLSNYYITQDHISHSQTFHTLPVMDLLSKFKIDMRSSILLPEQWLYNTQL